MSVDTLMSIKVFRTVVEQGSFVAAAERLDLSVDRYAEWQPLSDMGAPRRSSPPTHLPRIRSDVHGSLPDRFYLASTH
jgi:hypothetical protein